MSWARRFQIVAIVVAVIGAAFFGLLEYTQRPQFCVTCHYMEPYYQSWQNSSHNQVNCLKCHYPPGIKSAVRAKIVALSQVVQYVTKTYGTKPWAEVEDASCLRSGCHQTRLLNGAVPYGPDGTIRFDHSRHLKDLKWGKKLRCTSCHAQIVQGRHLTVNPSSCFLCHFRNISSEGNLSRCQTCHDVSRIPKNRFDHSHVLSNNVDCRRCHGDITRGTGEVPEQHCLTCHNEPDKLSKYAEVDFVHATHVKKHKVECSECHIEITHKLRKITVAEGLNCRDCHTETHVNQLRLFVGASAAEANRPLSPGPMFRVNVHCVGCHTSEAHLSDGGTVRKSTPASCDSCHSPGYGKVLRDWRELLTLRLDETQQALAFVSSRLDHQSLASEKIATAKAKIQEVKNGHGVHNIGFAVTLLAEAQKELQEVGEQAGVELTVSGVPEARLMRENECRLCHLNPPTQSFDFKGMAFPHGAHAQAVDQCTACHSSRSDHGKTTLKLNDCGRCHRGIQMPHPAKFRQEARSILQRTGFVACEACHKGPEAEACQPCHTVPADKVIEGVTFSHNKHMASPELSCLACHSPVINHGTVTVTKSQCTACHGGVEMPHPENWVETHPAFAGENGVDSCEKCHKGGMSGEFCGNCHG